MKVTQITATYGGKLNLGNYNSAHVELTATALLEEGETLEESTAQLMQQVKVEVRKHVRQLLKQADDEAAAVFNGLPADVRATMTGGQ